MSTRSVIARVGKHEGEFSGRYVHFDGMPMSRGPLLFQILHKEFKGDLSAMLRYLIDEHPAGWSTLDSEGRSCYCHPQKSKRKEFKDRQPEEAQTFTHRDVAKGETDIEWAYIFDEENNRMYIRDVRHDSENIVDLSKEPTEEEWSHIECGENYERYSHYAWAHNLVPKTCNLGTQTWLGRRPFDFHDAVAFIINGKRFKATGSGGHSDFYNTPLARQQRGFTKPFPRSTWVSSVIAGNGRRMDVPVAKVTSEGYEPLPGVVWVFPPTKDNPKETFQGHEENYHTTY